MEYIQINPMRFNKLKERLTAEESYKQFPYTDTTGNLTVGIGRNLSARGISRKEAEYLLANDLLDAEQALLENVPAYRLLDAVRQDVLIMMVFQLGIGSVLGFHTMLAALNAKNYAGAAQAMRESKWHEQTNARCERMAIMMETGE